VPEFHVPLSAVDVWAVTSLLTQTTVPPTATLSGLGAYAVVVNADAPATIETVAPCGVGPGAGGVGKDANGDGVGETGTDVEPPHPDDATSSAAPASRQRTIGGCRSRMTPPADPGAARRRRQRGFKNRSTDVGVCGVREAARLGVRPRVATKYGDVW